MRIKSGIIGIAIVLMAQSAALAVSIGELGRDCGDDAKQYCDGVRYGAPMQTCLAAKYKQLAPQCKAIMDRLDGGEKVTLF